MTSESFVGDDIFCERGFKLDFDGSLDYWTLSKLLFRPKVVAFFSSALIAHSAFSSFLAFFPFLPFLLVGVLYEDLRFAFFGIAAILL